MKAAVRSNRLSDYYEPTIMYEYRHMTAEERKAIVVERLARGYPPHQPPHPIRVEGYYLLTAACYEHQHHMKENDRRQQLLDLLFATFIDKGMSVPAWVILPNHYHLLVKVHEFDLLGDIFRRVHGRLSYEWNHAEGIQRRKVWYQYSDRLIRSERHYFASLNYIHFNPVKHGHVTSPYDWEQSSVHWYLAEHGQDWLRDTWRQYDVKNYGNKWDNY